MSPVILLILVALCVQMRWRLAASWAVASCFALGSIGVSKAVLYACGWRMTPALTEWMAVQSPSGHTVSAAMLVGGVTALLSRRVGWAGFRVAGSAAVLASLLIGWTRVSLQAHSVAEVALGLIVGVCGVAMLIVLAGPELERPTSRWVLAGIAVLVIAFHGYRAPAEQLFRSNLAEMIQAVVPACSRPL